MSAESTPRPWEAVNTNEGWKIKGAIPGYFVWIHGHCRQAIDGAEANAALIVQCVNEHDALVAERDRLRAERAELGERRRH